MIEADWYDYEAKYEPGGMELVVPAPTPRGARERVRALAVDAFLQVGCAGMARVDFFVETGRGPGAGERAEHDPRLHRHQRLRELFEASGVPYPELLDRLLGSRSSATSANGATY